MNHVGSSRAKLEVLRVQLCGTALRRNNRGRLSSCDPSATTIFVMSSESQSAPHTTEPVSSLYDTRLPQLSRWRRMQIPIIASAVIAVIRILGPTLRFEELGMHH